MSGGVRWLVRRVVRGWVVRGEVRGSGEREW